MGRKGRHTARTGDGGAEIRHKKRQLKEAESVHKVAELEFHDDPSEDLNSDDDTSDGSEFGDEEEVLQLGGDDDDEDDADSDQNGDESGSDDVGDVDEFGDEGEKARLSNLDSKWGKSKKNFYSADTADFELEDDEEAAKDEESAALELQRKQATMMDNEDFDLDEQDEGDDEDDRAGDVNDGQVDDEELLGDQLADISMIVDEGSGASVEQVKKDFSKLSKKDKLQIVNQTAPELLGLTAEMERTMKDLNDVVTPAIKKLTDIRPRTKAYNTGLQYLVTRQNLMLNYVANISFYLLLRAEGKSVTDHPVLQHLLALKKQMIKLQDVNDTVNRQLHDLLTQEFPEDVEDGMDQFFGGVQQQQATKKTDKRSSPNVPEKATKHSGATKSMVSDAEKEEAARFYVAAMREKQALGQANEQFYSHEKPGLASSDDDDSDMDDGAKRGASYQIIKNKGLQAHKSKLNRNPRVKKRMQYRKAVIRRKGQVRDVRVGEAGRYGGETTGIKSNLTRSRKIRN